MHCTSTFQCTEADTEGLICGNSLSTVKGSFECYYSSGLVTIVWLRNNSISEGVTVLVQYFSMWDIHMLFLCYLYHAYIIQYVPSVMHHL